jgi:hypothetical protein
MGIIDKINKGVLPKVKDTLEQHEIEFILSMIKQSTFKGENIEPLYNIVLKLQSQHINLKDRHE